MDGNNRRAIKVFLCHASGDKPSVRELYKRLIFEGVDAWLDKEKLLPGQDWRMEIPRAVRESDVVVVCLSNKSITKEGYVQKEIKFALDIAEEKPEGTIFLIPARLEDCIVPERLSRWQWVDLYEENGFIQLLRSLKLRAEAVDASVEPALYVDSERELDRKLDQWYTEGLAAFYTEDWDRACQRFQSILSERPNHKNAAEKLTEAEKQRELSKLYEQASAVVRSGEWESAIRILEELSRTSADYKDTAQLLHDARKQKQLRDLYAEAKALHAAQQWEAVVRVFEQISVIEPNYPDADGLLPSAQKEVAELRRLADLNDQYSHALREMDTGNWYEARKLLETVHKSQTGFLETEKLLRKVDGEIFKEEQKRKQNDQVNTLYEQAHGLLRSNKWRNALDKMEEIRKLDERFPDTDGIAEKAQKELAREEQEAERQNKLAALYAEAVRLLKEEKHQEALDKWGEVRAIDPKYPDRQWVARTAKKELAKQTKPVQLKPRFVMSRQLWMGIVGLIVVGAVIIGLVLSDGGNQGVFPASTQKNTQTSAVLPANPTATDIPGKTNTPRSATAVPAGGGYSDPTMYDDFGISTYNGRYNTSLWESWTDVTTYEIAQSNGKLSITVNSKNGAGLYRSYSRIRKPTFFEAREYLDPNTTNNGGHLFIVISNDHGYSNCGVFGDSINRQSVKCWSEYYGKKVEPAVGLDAITPGWHVFRFEIDPGTMIINYIVDGKKVGQYDPKESIPDHFNEFKQSSFDFNIAVNNYGPSKALVGYIDYVRMGAIEDDPTLYDGFNMSTYNGRFNSTKWAYDQHDKDGSAIQQDGVLVFTQSGIEKGQKLRANEYWPLKLTESVVFEANLKTDMTSDGQVVMTMEGDVIVFVSCGVHSASDAATAHCWTQSGDHTFTVTHGTWHVVRIEVNLTTNTVTTYINGKKLSEDRYTRSLRNSTLYLNINVWAGPGRVESTRPMIGYVDNVRVYPLEYVNP
jgi:outer membrane protein assembly factor BamD (BamD/ComL family)